MAEADDYLVKPFDRHELKVRVEVGARIVELQRILAERVRELEEAIVERRQAEDALRDLTLADDLTSLLNRRGFFTFAQHYLKTARRTEQNSLIIYGDMDGLKQINDTLGHHEGSLAICRMADVLRETFRESDIIARLGGDEFAVLATDVSPAGRSVIIRRLRENLSRYNEANDHGCDLSLSIGSVDVAPRTTSTLEELIAAADAAMYKDKLARKSVRLNEVRMPGAATSFRPSLISSR